MTAKFLIENGNEREQLDEALRAQLLIRDTKRLRLMERYCKTTGCYRAALLDYFGELHASSCGCCGNCARREDEPAGKTTEEDITLAAQKILSCLRRVERKNRVGLGETTLVKVLTGSRDKTLLQREYDLLPTYSIMKDTKRPLLHEYIRELVKQGYLCRPSGDYDVLITAEKANNVLFQNEQVLWRHLVPEDGLQGKKTVAAGRLGAADRDLFDRLRALRARLARQAGVPAYVIFHDATLMNIASAQPSTEAELLAVSGVGAQKASKYGQAVLAVIAEEKTGHEASASAAGSYPANLLREIFDEPTALPPDVVQRLRAAMNDLFAGKNRNRKILCDRYEFGKTLESIGSEQGVSLERIRQILEKNLRMLRRKNVRAYLSGETEQLRKPKARVRTEPEPLLRLRPEQLARYVFRPEGISMTAFARALTELKEEGQPGELTGRQLSDRLLAEGYLTELLSETDNLFRRPTPAGESVGILLAERIGKDGKPFTMVTLTEQSQRWFIDRLSKE